MKLGLVFGWVVLVSACTPAQPVCPKVIVVKPEITIIQEGTRKIKKVKKVKQSAGHKAQVKTKDKAKPMPDPVSDRALLMPIDTEQDE